MINSVIFWLKQKQNTGWFFVIYFLILFLVIPHSISWGIQINFLIYASFIFWLLYGFMSKEDQPENLKTEKYKKFFIGLLILAFIFFLLTRFLPFFLFGKTPLGYDTGFYIHAIKTDVEPGPIETRAFYLLMFPLKFLELPPLVIFYFIYGLSQFLIFGALYFLFKSLKMPSSFALAVVGAFLFSISSVQFLGYWSVFGRQMMATSFLLVTLALFLRQSPLMILTGGLTFLIHTPTFLVLASVLPFLILFYIGKMIFYKKFNSKIILLFLLTFIFFLFLISLKESQILREIDFIRRHSFFLKDYPSWAQFEARGGFIELISFRFYILFFLPFSLFSFFYPGVWERFNLGQKISFNSLFVFYLLFIILAVLTFYPLLYQSRFSLIFDLFLIIFAAPSFLLLLNNFLLERVGKIFIFFLLLFFLGRTILVVSGQKPLISPDEIQEIEELSSKIEPRGIIMATNSSYGPWLLGFSGREIISPGHLYDQWSLDTWVEFWRGDNNEEKLRLLKTRTQPLYIYIGTRQPQGQSFEEFIRKDTLHFTQISPHAWKFNFDL